MKPKLLVLVLALQSAWILATTFQQERALRVGKIIMLETERVDPRDLLRGNYLILNYKISSVPTNMFSPPLRTELTAGTKVFVALKPGTNQFHAVSRASTDKLEPDADEVVLCGKSQWGWWNTTNAVRVEYGLERYYVAEGRGNPRGKLTVQAVVPESGNASIKEVFVGGKPYVEAMKNSE